MVIGNRADGGVLYWLVKLYGFAFLIGAIALGLVAVLTYDYYASRVPRTPKLGQYTRDAPIVSRVYAADGTLLGEFASEWRELVAFDQIPPQLVHAFLAAEDHRFFHHHGIDLRGIGRALWTNAVTGDFTQGGSTITQQVAKQFLGADKSLARKAREAVLARRLESTYSKQAILSLYLNHIYLGNGAYGVKAAAHRYFDKALTELDLGEVATLGGLAQAPTRFSPVTHPARARRRRDHVLDRMAKHGYIASDEAATWKARPIVVARRKELFPGPSPYFTEHLRRYVIDKYGAERLMSGGLRIEASVQPVVDASAYANVDVGARRQDKRQGWRGPEAFLEGKARATFVQRALALYGAGPLVPGRRYLALVEKLHWNRATVRVADRAYVLHLDDMQWAAPWTTRGRNDEHIWRVDMAIKPGDVVWVSKKKTGRAEHDEWYLDQLRVPQWHPAETANDRTREKLASRVVLEQTPHPQMAILTADHRTGYVQAMVGGTSFARSQYNRAAQSCRQPGSTYKPIYYSAAMDRGYGFDARLSEKPVKEIDPITGEEWTPLDMGGIPVENHVTLEYALVFSKNVPSVDIFKKVGADEVARWARKLGFTTEIIPDLALALGASCTKLDELSRAFALFARHGQWIDWVYTRRILDRDGNTLEDNTVLYDPMLAPGDRFDRVYATAGARPRQAIPARTAYLTDKLLSQTIRHGFAKILRGTGIHAAGKTGTSSATMDTTFVAYTSRWITTVWMGDDLRERPLGLKDAAFITVMPVWSRYMAEVTQGHENLEVPWATPAGVDPNDRGGRKGSNMSRSNLVYHWPKRKPVVGADADVDSGASDSTTKRGGDS